MSLCPGTGPLAVGLCGHSFCFDCLPSLGLRAICPHCQMEGAFILGKKNYLVEELRQYMERPRTIEEEENISKMLLENVRDAENELANLEEEYQRLLAVSEERQGQRERERHLERPFFWRLGAERREGGLDEFAERRLEERVAENGPGTARRLENQLRRPNSADFRPGRHFARQNRQLEENQRIREEHRLAVQGNLEESRAQRHRQLLREVSQRNFPGFFGGQQINWNGSFNQNIPRHQQAAQVQLPPPPMLGYPRLAYVLPNTGNLTGQPILPRNGQNFP